MSQVDSLPDRSEQTSQREQYWQQKVEAQDFSSVEVPLSNLVPRAGESEIREITNPRRTKQFQDKCSSMIQPQLEGEAAAHLTEIDKQVLA